MPRWLKGEAPLPDSGPEGSGLQDHVALAPAP